MEPDSATLERVCCQTLTCIFFLTSCSAACGAAGLEYDLNLFNIVAVSDFNMGAMENKSLNVFNSRLVIASPATSTDLDFARVEGVVAHEYFHKCGRAACSCPSVKERRLLPD